MLRPVMILMALAVMFPRLANCGEAPGQIEKREITVQEGRVLLNKALESTGAASLPKFSIVYWENSSTPRFYFFTGTWDNKGQGSAVTGNYYVDRQTGDVWRAESCEELKSPALEQLKSEIRGDIGLSEIDYKKIRIDGPIC
ncbi:MAG TPA: hypothetical protein VMB19_02510 [Silvibacterium sp.]|nr:hypothetical protein [Silvibacterium sp.]